jgi:phage terminase large subunit GpA-like protein
VTGPLDVTNCFGAQTYKTTASFVGVSYRVEYMPSAVMMRYPTYDFAKKFAEVKWLPLIENSPVMQKHLPQKR